MSKLRRKFKINGLNGESVASALRYEREFAAMPFGRQIEPLKTIAKFKETCKSIWLSQKRQSYQTAIAEAKKMYDVKEYYCEFYCDEERKDDSFEFWYR